MSAGKSPRHKAREFVVQGLYQWQVGGQDAAAIQVQAEGVAGVDKAIAGLSLATQKEIEELFDLLAFAPTRLLAAGLWSPWPEATPEAIGKFLQGWRFSRFNLLKSGYAALHDLVFGAWYARPDTWAAIGYPGPPKVE